MRTRSTRQVDPAVYAGKFADFKEAGEEVEYEN
jgi:hypothetical protein